MLWWWRRWVELLVGIISIVPDCKPSRERRRHNYCNFLFPVFAAVFAAVFTTVATIVATVFATVAAVLAPVFATVFATLWCTDDALQSPAR